MVEDEVPCAVSEGLDVAQFRDDGRQAGLRRRDPLGGFVWMLEITQVIVGEEPASLPVVPGETSSYFTKRTRSSARIAMSATSL